MNLDRIFIGRDGRQLGPYTLAELRRYLAEGRIAPDDQAWCEGMSGWQTLANAREIQHALASLETPPPDPETMTPPAPAYHHVAAWKFVVLCLATGGIYELYWFYQNWRCIQERDGSDIWPFWRTVFLPVWCFPLCADVNAHGGRIPPASAVAVTAAYILISAMAGLLPPWSLLGLFSFIPLLVIVAQINFLNRARGARADYYERFTAGHIAVAAIGLLLLGLVLLTEFVAFPGSPVLTGDQIPAEDLQFLHKKKIVFGSEQIFFFFSAGILSAKENGCLLTQERVISYTQVPESEDILAKSARFADIEDIRIERARSPLDKSRITIVTRNGPEFDLILPAVAHGDEPFVNKLMTLWQSAKLKN